MLCPSLHCSFVRAAPDAKAALLPSDYLIKFASRWGFCWCEIANRFEIATATEQRKPSAKNVGENSE